MRSAAAPATVGNTAVVELPPAALRAQLAPKTVDPKTRTVELTWTTGQPVLRQSAVDGELYYEELEVSPRAVDLRRLKRGAALLAAHQATSLEGVLGVVEDAWLTNGAGHARVRFSARPKAAEIFAEVKAGIIRNVSVGYITHEAEELDRKRGQLRVVRATRWEPLELSLVAVPADSGAVLRARAGAQYPCTIIRRGTMETSALQPDRAPAGAADDLVAEVNRMFDEAKARVAAASGTTPSVPRATAAAMTRALLYHHDPTRYRLHRAGALDRWPAAPRTRALRAGKCRGSHRRSLADRASRPGARARNSGITRCRTRPPQCSHACVIAVCPRTGKRPTCGNVRSGCAGRCHVGRAPLRSAGGPTRRRHTRRRGSPPAATRRAFGRETAPRRERPVPREVSGSQRLTARSRRATKEAPTNS